MIATIGGDRSEGCMIANLNLYLHADNNVGSATRCYLLVRGTKIGQRRLTEQMANCTADVRSTVFAEEIIRIVAIAPRDEIEEAHFTPQKPEFRPQFGDSAALLDDFIVGNKAKKFSPVVRKGRRKPAPTNHRSAE